MFLFCSKVRADLSLQPLLFITPIIRPIFHVLFLLTCTTTSPKPGPWWTWIRWCLLNIWLPSRRFSKSFSPSFPELFEVLVTLFPCFRYFLCRHFFILLVWIIWVIFILPCQCCSSILCVQWLKVHSCRHLVFQISIYRDKWSAIYDSFSYDGF